ncbi:hypothetical protein ACW7G2_12160 [Luteimonas sp. A277]
MKGLLRSCFIIAASGLAACASQADMRLAAPVATTTIQSDVFRNDAAYISGVERIARRRGVEVHWIHPPLLRPDTAVVDNGLE